MDKTSPMKQLAADAALARPTCVTGCSVHQHHHPDAEAPLVSPAAGISLPHYSAYVNRLVETPLPDGLTLLWSVSPRGQQLVYEGNLLRARAVLYLPSVPYTQSGRKLHPDLQFVVFGNGLWDQWGTESDVVPCHREGTLDVSGATWREAFEAGAHAALNALADISAALVARKAAWESEGAEMLAQRKVLDSAAVAHVPAEEA